jgi:hypothetical protein
MLLVAKQQQWEQQQRFKQQEQHSDMAAAVHQSSITLENQRRGSAVIYAMQATSMLPLGLLVAAMCSTCLCASQHSSRHDADAVTKWWCCHCV